MSDVDVANLPTLTLTADPNFVPVTSAVLNNPALAAVRSAEPGAWYPLPELPADDLSRLVNKVRAAANTLDMQVRIRHDLTGRTAFSYTGRPIARRAS